MSGVKGESNMPNTSCMKRSSTMDAIADKQSTSGANCAMLGNAAGANIAAGGMSTNAVGTTNAIGTTGITIDISL